MTRRARLSAIAVVVTMGLIFALSSRRPPGMITGLGIPDGWLHLFEYAWLGFLLSDLAATGAGGRRWLALVLLPALVGTLYGASDEWHQAFVPGRDSSLADLGMDALGSSLGATIRWGLVVLGGGGGEGDGEDASATSRAPGPSGSSG